MPTTIVTNMPRQKKVLDLFADHLHDGQWLDVFSCNFEAAAFLLFGTPWETIEKTRVLVGSHEKPKPGASAWDRIRLVNERSIEHAKAKGDDTAMLSGLREAIDAGRIEIKSYSKDKLSGAAYILSGSDGNRTGLIGSTDLTVDDLKYPIELNVVLDKEQCRDLSQLFDRLYDDAEDIGDRVVEQIARHTREFAPYEVYLKSLFEYFRGREITAGVWEEEESNVYRILSGYQRDGYRQLLHIADKYNGALLCDGVGLGKTFVALMLIERMVHERKRVAVIVPKSTRDAVWEVLINRHIPHARGVFGSQVVVYNHTDLLRGASKDRDFGKEMQEIQEQCDVIIVDEAHHFRNLSSKRNQKLFEMTDGKLVFLLTATPINNSLFDLQHLMEFFTRRNDGRFAHLGINSVKGNLVLKERAIEAKMGLEETDEIVSSDYDVTEADRILRDDTLFREVVVQRSRQYVKQREQGASMELLFPERQPPSVADYSLKATYGSLLDELRGAFDRNEPLLKLPIYYPMAYARKPADNAEGKMEENRQRQIVGLVRTTMLKRFESSWKAFQYTCEDLLLKLLASLNALSPKKYEKWHDGNALWLHDIEKHLAERYDRSEDAEDVEEDDLLGVFADRVPHLDKRLYKVPEITADIERDLDLLVKFLGYLRGLSSKTDVKLQKLIGLLTGDDLLGKHKVVIFSEFRDTARYVYRILRETGVRNLVEIDSGSKLDRLEVIRRFAPFYNYETEEKHNKALAQPIRVLISTDILAEGLNLQDAFLMVNYDLHWNPVRLMQRIGRVDRRMNPETEAKIHAARPEEVGLRGKMWYWNFLPPEELNDLLSLYRRVSHKVLRISETTGLEGEQLLTPEDHFNTMRDFNEAYEGQPNTEERLRLLLNNALRDDPELPELLEALPWRIFSAKHATGKMNGLFACYRFPVLGKEQAGDELGELHWYFLPDGGTDILTSVEAIDAYIASTTETVRETGRPLAVRRKDLKKIERYIKTRELKTRKNTTMAQVVGGRDNRNRLQLVAWMDVMMTPTADKRKTCSI